jgi:signal transduction histidine kinase
LVARTVATGSSISCELPDDLDELPGRLATVVYRIVQEGLTNAIKHAPGAAIDICVAANGTLRVYIRNAATRSTAPAAPGSGRGIAGLTERVHAADGTFSSGPSSQGGWLISAELPLSQTASLGIYGA